jgi:ribA/ribD-fused uncharacterized protein
MKMTDTIERFSDEFAFLSNFHEAHVEYEGITYPSVEHAFQAAKTNDEQERKMIREALSAGKAKRLGKKVKLRKDWELVKIGIMEELIRKKFMNKQLREMLLKTGDKILIEGNDWNDTFWGVCNGKGQNNLGLIIMKIRGEIK